MIVNVNVAVSEPLVLVAITWTVYCPTGILFPFLMAMFPSRSRANSPWRSVGRFTNSYFTSSPLKFSFLLMSISTACTSFTSAYPKLAIGSINSTVFSVNTFSNTTPSGENSLIAFTLIWYFSPSLNPWWAATDNTPVVGSIVILSVFGLTELILYTSPSAEPFNAGILLWKVVSGLRSPSSSIFPSSGVYINESGREVTLISNAFSKIPFSGSSPVAAVVSLNDRMYLPGWMFWFPLMMEISPLSDTAK